MRQPQGMSPLLAAVVVTATLGVATQMDVSGQGRGGGPQAARTAQAIAPVDLTGYWAAVVTEDWRWRMVTPPRGDVSSVPVNADGRRVANAWDLEADNAAGLQCKAFGVGGIMRQPGRIHITWQDEQTLKLDFDAGTQTRLLHFDRTRQPPADRTWQGHSMAEWQGPALGRGGEAPPGPGAGPAGPPVPGGGGRGLRGAPPPRLGVINQGGSISVRTTHFREGYLRKNGVPYSEDATITEHVRQLPPHPNGDVWLHVLTIVEDPRYLSQPFYTSTHFKREADGSGWNPTPCQTEPPLGQPS